MHKIIEDDTPDRIDSGLAKLKDAISPTLGPLGKLVLLDRLTMFPTATKDGANVSREVESRDPVEDMAIRVCREIALRTEEEAGDGTTSSIIMAEALVRHGRKMLKEGKVNYFTLKEQLEDAVEAAVEYIKDISKYDLSAEELKAVIRVSSNYDETLVNLISKALEDTERSGTILIDEARGSEDSLDIVQGFSYEKGIYSPYFFTEPDKEECNYENVLVFLYKSRLDDVNFVAHLMGNAAKAGRPLLIVCDDISPEVITLLVVNKMQSGFKGMVTQTPHHGDRHWAVFEDFAAVANTSVFDAHSKSTIDMDSLGSVKSIRINKRRTVVVAEDSGPVKVRIQEQIQSIQKRSEKETSLFMRTYLKERVARLTGGVAHIRIGAPTDLEMREKKDRAADAYLAALSALESGIVAGGGVTWMQLWDVLSLSKDYNEGYELLARAVISPPEILAQNAGMSAENMKEFQRCGLGYNGRSGQYENLMSVGIVDPSKVLIKILQNATSVALILLNVAFAISYDQADDIKKHLEE